MIIASSISGEFFDVTQDCNKINHQTIIDYINHIRKTKPNISDVSISSYLRGIRAIIYYFISLGYTNTFKISLIKAEKPIKQTYTDYELQLLLKKPEISKCPFTEYRNWVIINYLLSTGNRASTIINLKIGDIDFSNETIILTKTKNRKQQLIPLSRTLVSILTEYVKYRKGTNDDYLFCNAYGNKLTVYGLGQAIQHYNLARRVTKTSLHLFRHTFAKKWILNGGDIFRLQKILGHSTLQMVKEYVNMYEDDLRQNFNEFNPLESLAQTGKHISMR